MRRSPRNSPNSTCPWSARTIDLSSGDDRLISLPARYAVSTGHSRLVRYDLASGSAVERTFDGESRPGEAVFVPSLNGPAGEDNGWYVVYVYDPGRDGSDLVIIDSSDFSGQPVAKIKMPQRVPYGFHGNWITAA